MKHENRTNWLRPTPKVVLWIGRSPVNLVSGQRGPGPSEFVGRLANDQVRVFVSRARPTEQVMSEILPGRVESGSIGRIPLGVASSRIRRSRGGQRELSQ